MLFTGTSHRPAQVKKKKQLDTHSCGVNVDNFHDEVTSGKHLRADFNAMTSERERGLVPVARALPPQPPPYDSRRWAVHHRIGLLPGQVHVSNAQAHAGVRRRRF